MTTKLPTTVSVDETKSFTADAVYQEYLKWLPKYEEFAQGRTNFQIEKFVSLEDGTPANNYVNVLYQTRVMRGEFMREVKRGLELQRNFDYRWTTHLETHGPNVPIEVEDGESGKKFVWYDLEKLELEHTVHELRLSIKDKIQQLETFEAILNKLEENNGGNFTKDQYENEAPDYWEKRLERQSVDDIVSARLGVSTGNVKSIRQAMAPTILDNSPNQIKGEDPLIKRLIDGRFDVYEAINEGNKSIESLYEKNTQKGFLPKAEQTETKKIEVKEDDSDPYALSEEMLKNLLGDKK
jgi:hypothetical protein